MSRKFAKGFQPTLPTQFTHLRFVDTEANTILNNGGYTLAYRLLHIESEQRIHVQYAYSECNLLDNFNKAEGRQRTYHRLMAQAPEFTGEFSLNAEQLGADFQSKLVQLNANINTAPVVDVMGKEFDVAEAVIRNFLNEWGGALYLGADDEHLTNHLVPYRNGLAISADALDYLSEEVDADSLLDDMAEVLEVTETGLAKLNKPIDVTNAAAVTELLDSLRVDFQHIRDALIDNGVSLDDEEAETQEG